MYIIFLGPPGSGKGTQSKKISKYFGIPNVSSGDLLRVISNSSSQLASKIFNILSSGSLVSDDLIIKVLKEYFLINDLRKGLIFDGFPRNINQAVCLEKLNIPIDYVVEIAVKDSTIIERLSGRLLHQSSGRTYHIKYKPPKIHGKDDITGEDLFQRPDDIESIIKKRLLTYRTKTFPLVHYYRSHFFRKIPAYIKVDGDKKIDLITQEIIDYILKHKTSN